MAHHGLRNGLAVPASKHSGDTGEDEAPWWQFWTRRRYLVACLAFFGFFNVYALRVNLSVAIVAMTTNYTVQLDNGTLVQRRDFDWDSTTQGVVLSSFFYGYIVTQLPGGWLSARIGGHRVFAVGVGVTAFLTLLTPAFANISVNWLIAIRVVEGVFEGVTYPTIHAIWARWAPPLERSRLATIAFSGCYVGTVVSLPLSGILAEHAGWPYVFYFFGVLGLIWCVIWWLIVEEGPEFDPKISPKELKYIQDSLGSSQNANKSVPWKQILTSLPVWAIVVAHCSENWGFYTLLTQLPTFMRDALNFKIEKAGFMSALPYLVMAIVIQFAGHLADWLQKREILTTTSVRKVYTCGAFLSQTVFMLLAGFLLTPAGAITCLSIAVGLGAFAWSGFGVNHLDISPQHASVIMGFGNTFATLPGIISPTITGYIVRNKEAHEWQTVFYITSAIYLFGAAFYAVFASGVKQPWSTQPAVEATQSAVEVTQLPLETKQPAVEAIQHTNNHHAHVNQAANLQDE